VLETVIVILVLAVAMAARHLGSSRNAIRAAANVRASWLSRETVSDVVFGLLVVTADIGYRFEIGSPMARRLWVAAAAVAGLVLVYAMARLYMLRTVPAWNTAATPAAFLTATLLLGMVGIAGVLVVAGDFRAGVHSLLTGMLPWFAWSCMLLVAVLLAVTARQSEDAPPQEFAASRAMWVLSALLGLGGAGLLLAAVNLASQEPVSERPGELGIVIASALLVASVVASRCRFYASYRRVGL
jgi:DMSO reductase anchor subunit